MASDTEAEVVQTNGIVHDERASSPLGPITPHEVGPLPDSSQRPLPSTEIPNSPIDPNESFKTEINDERQDTTVIPSSLTPPPSSAQVPAHNGASRHGFPSSQQSNYYSPPATITAMVNGRDTDSDYEPPTPQQVREAPAEQLRIMLQNCIADQKRLKMETAHYKLQSTLLRIQSEEDSKRASVEFEMMRREVAMLLHVEQTRHAKRELSASQEVLQVKFMELKSRLDAALEDNETLKRRHNAAKKVIQQKDEELHDLLEERDLLLNRIRENREHMYQLRSPGGLFHEAVTPKQHVPVAPGQSRGTPRQTPKVSLREESQHGLSTLLQAISQGDDGNNASAPTTPQRAAPRQNSKHHRNAQSMSSLPITPINRPGGEQRGLLPSVDLVPQTEPSRRYSSRSFMPINKLAMSGELGRKSRESTISAEDNEELARQAIQSAAAAQSFTTAAPKPSQSSRSRPAPDDDDETDVFDSQASQAAREMLRRDARQSFEVAAARKASPPLSPEESARTTARPVPEADTAQGMDKRKFSGQHWSAGDASREPDSPTKKKRTEGSAAEEEQRRLGLGIQQFRRKL
ncbi:hypothetical protein S7711_08170 [Stachybotrys chartarum IBT 7711]|uniref:Uncharacterized protein n=1 Tax=Stachybotrys chartarum (strain CBS 109288 / IBT 7711) TaxID=1280523 RepID=A0A084ANK9_STACB|nr:hypothetical protein S7711_08170 [Stachybotrys chartarum IBT 7711]KFA54752.1 hypothetical protein S40293_00683 [Stachybotrys chartarum IBT 40293]KFA80757.1 hypothetical protein S40288_05564 [Stachybotrys chartarum IBT 40288]